MAILYLCCDDIDAERLDSLHQLGDFDIFILDDSRTAYAREQANRSGFRVVRRHDRAHYKAGNLNHWLAAYGERYDYFVVLDSDSIISPDAVRDLVSHAEAEENRDVAIVQSSTLPRAGNRFQRHLSSQSAVRNAILSRLYDRIGWTISHGHNNLHRTAAIRSIGGFDTTATCEDTATSLRLARSGWRVILVDTMSHDAEPTDIVAYRRRHVRWARQTVDVIAAMRGSVTFPHALLMARHVLGYLLPIAGSVSLALVVFAEPGWISPSEWVVRRAVICAFAASILAIAVLRVLLCIRARQRVGTLLLSGVLHGATVAFCCMQTATGMLQSLFRRRVGFTPTGMTPTTTPTLLRLLSSMAGSWIVYVAVAMAGRPSPIQLFWIACFLSSPVVLWLFQRDEGAGR